MKYIMRLDDACEYRDVLKWNQMEELLDKYEIKPLVGIIPHCEDTSMTGYEYDADFWQRVSGWQNKNWAVAMHGYNHVYASECGGINPVNKRSEFAGLSLEEQSEKIKAGVAIMREHGIDPKIFFAPSHTFDENTLTALSENSNVKIISDTIATKPYAYKGFTFVPQQSGRVRKLRFNTVTFCYHPNMMKEKDFLYLEEFLKENKDKFIPFPDVTVKRKRSLIDKLLNFIYMRKHR